MTGRRSRTHERMRAIAERDEAPLPKKKISREQWVIRVATRIVGTKMGGGFVQADDAVSDILLALMNAGGFGWEEEEIEDFCRRKASYIVRRYTARREKNECEFSSGGDEDEPFDIISLAGWMPAMQEICFEAKRASGLLCAIPHRHRRALEILIGGGNPIDVSEEMRVTPWDAVRLIKEAREYVRRVDPLSDAA